MSTISNGSRLQAMGSSFAFAPSQVGSASCGLLLTRRVLCSVDDQRRTLEEIFRVLKPGAERGDGFKIQPDVSMGQVYTTRNEYGSEYHQDMDRRVLVLGLPFARLPFGGTYF